MINYIKGMLSYKSPILAVIESSGLGWELRIPVSTFEVLPAENSPCSLFTHMVLSQDDIRLYGFATMAEKKLYQELTRISGIGPKIAMSILSTLSVATFIKSVANSEEAVLTRVPGIGKKSAQRLIVELKDRIHNLMDHVEESFEHTNQLAEVESALSALGFNSNLILRELKMLSEEDQAMPTEQLIKEIIKRLYQRAK